MKVLILSTCMFMQLISLQASETTIPQKVLMLIPFKDFSAEEYCPINEELTNAGYLVHLASTEKGIATATDGKTTASINSHIFDVNITEYDALIFVGGRGILNFRKTPYVLNLLTRACALDKIMGAICLAPRFFSSAGILKEKHATGWNGDGDLQKTFGEQGVLYDPRPVVVDETLITASGPQAATDFARTIIQALKNRKK